MTVANFFHKKKKRNLKFSLQSFKAPPCELLQCGTNVIPLVQDALRSVQQTHCFIAASSLCFRTLRFFLLYFASQNSRETRSRPLSLRLLVLLSRHIINLPSFHILPFFTTRRSFLPKPSRARVRSSECRPVSLGMLQRSLKSGCTGRDAGCLLFILICRGFQLERARIVFNFRYLGPILQG